MIRYLIKGINRLTENLNKANQRMGAHVMNLMSEESEKAIICLNAYLDKKFVTDFDKYQELTRPQICSRVQNIFYLALTWIGMLQMMLGIPLSKMLLMQ